MGYEQTPLMVCRPEVTAKLLESIRETQQRLLATFLEKREEFAIVVGGRNGEFIGNLLSQDVDQLIKRPAAYFRAIQEEYTLYFNAVHGRTILSVTKNNTTADDLFDILRFQFGSQLVLLIQSYRLYIERTTAWEKYWKKEFA
ncbi:MAG TPA: hypothetical protein VK158_00835 [Acidobacteriota bacterium]|nr:hypothetical protein [Acidobacteriota bacterium]